MAKIEIQLEKNLEKRQHKNFLVYSAVKEWIWCVDIHYTKSKHTHLMKENQRNNATSEMEQKIWHL